MRSLKRPLVTGAYLKKRLIATKTILIVFSSCMMDFGWTQSRSLMNKKKSYHHMFSSKTLIDFRTQAKIKVLLKSRITQIQIELKMLSSCSNSKRNMQMRIMHRLQDTFIYPKPSKTIKFKFLRKLIKMLMILITLIQL